MKKSGIWIVVAVVALALAPEIVGLLNTAVQALPWIIIPIAYFVGYGQARKSGKKVR